MNLESKEDNIKVSKKRELTTNSFKNGFKNYVGYVNTLQIEGQFFKGVDNTKNKELKKLLYNDYFNFYEFRTKIGYELSIGKGKFILGVLKYDVEGHKGMILFELQDRLEVYGFPKVKKAIYQVSLDNEIFKKLSVGIENIKDVNLKYTWNEDTNSYHQSVVFIKENEIINEKTGREEIVIEENQKQMIDLKIDFIPVIEFKNTFDGKNDLNNFEEFINEWAIIFGILREEIEISKNNFWFLKQKNLEQKKKIEEKLKDIIDKGQRLIGIDYNKNDSFAPDVGAVISPMIKDFSSPQILISILSYIEEKVSKWLFLKRDNEFSGAQKNEELLNLKEEPNVLYIDYKKKIREYYWKRLFEVVLPKMDPKLANNGQFKKGGQIIDIKMKLKIEDNTFNKNKKAAMEVKEANKKLIEANASFINYKRKIEKEKIEIEKRKIEELKKNINNVNNEKNKNNFENKKNKNI